MLKPTATIAERLDYRIKQRVAKAVPRLEGETDEAFEARTEDRRNDMSEALADRVFHAFAPELHETVEEIAKRGTVQHDAPRTEGGAG